MNFELWVWGDGVDYMSTRYWLERYVASQGYSVERNPAGTYLSITVECCGLVGKWVMGVKL